MKTNVFLNFWKPLDFILVNSGAYLSFNQKKLKSNYLSAIHWIGSTRGIACQSGMVQSCGSTTICWAALIAFETLRCCCFDNMVTRRGRMYPLLATQCWIISTSRHVITSLFIAACSGVGSQKSDFRWCGTGNRSFGPLPFRCGEYGLYIALYWCAFKLLSISFFSRLLSAVVISRENASNLKHEIDFEVKKPNLMTIRTILNSIFRFWIRFSSGISNRRTHTNHRSRWVIWYLET